MLEVQSLFSAFGLSASAGLNAYIPLLMIALAGRFRPDLVRLDAPFDMLTSGWAIGLLILLLAIEIMADKVPVVDHVNDAIGLFIRPAAGAVLFAASTGTVSFLDPRVAMGLGFIVAGAAHGAKATARPMVTASTGGVGNPIVSVVEDVAAFFTSLFAIIAPIVLGLALIAFAVIFAWWMTHRPRRRGSVAPPLA